MIGTANRLVLQTEGHDVSLPQRSVRVAGTVELEPTMGAFNGAHLIVQLEDNSLADASADILARQVIGPLSYGGMATMQIPFSLDAKIPAGDPYLNVRAHLARHPGDDIEVGDWVTTRMFRFHPSDANSAMRVLLRPV